MSSARLKHNALPKPVRRSVLRRMLLVVGTVMLTNSSHAQTVARDVALPFYTPGHLMHGVYRFWYVPQSEDFASQSAALPDAIKAVCDAETTAGDPLLQRARAQWETTAAAWDRLSGVQVGPLVQRRSARQIDFAPTRPELIERAIRTAPADAAAMELVGTPAKGLPALEWLLWTRPVAPDTPACRYAVQVAADVSREAAALATGFNELAARGAGDDEAHGPAMGELVNQWVGGLERLRWADMEKPALRAATRSDEGSGAGKAAFPRSASEQTAASWAAHWQALRTLAVFTGSEPPQPGMALVPLETYLRGRGLNPLADTLVKSVAGADKSLRDLLPTDRSGINVATRELTRLKKLAEAEVAPALEVPIGFSDADGD
jgi:hypothetical protein